MKNAGTSAPQTADTTQGQFGPGAVPQSNDGRTRHAVARLLLERGPVAAAEVAEVLGLSPPAVRRHLDALVADGQASTRDAPKRGRRGRGRPAKLFLLTESGRSRFGHAYDDLAVAALRFLAEHGGEDAVRAFAERRVASLVDRHRAAIAAAHSPAERAKALAAALTREGYAASTRHVGAGEQLCQHHCPVAHVAAEFPQFCETETAAFADVLGTHVQRLATIARGDAACTTHVPVATRTDEPGARPTEQVEPTEQTDGSPSAPPISNPAAPPQRSGGASGHTARSEPDQAQPARPAPDVTARIPDGGEPA